MLAIILLVIAAVLYLWSRRTPVVSHRDEKSDHPDVVLGLAEYKKPLTVVIEPVSEIKPPIPPEPVKIKNPPLERIILFLRAPGGRQYGGYELLQSLLTCGLRFGEMNIFHRYEQRPDGQTVLFSVAAATKTGELIPADLGDFFCSGLSIFITLNQHIYPSVNFELMLDTARQLAEDLSGILLDENQNPLSREKVQKIREKIRNFETSRQNMELFV